MLLDAACAYNRHASQPEHAQALPSVLFLITGEQQAWQGLPYVLF